MRYSIYLWIKECVRMAAAACKSTSAAFLVDTLSLIMAFAGPQHPWCNELEVRGQLLGYDYCEHWGVQRATFGVQGMSHSALSCHTSPPEAGPPD